MAAVVVVATVVDGATPHVAEVEVGSVLDLDLELLACEKKSTLSSVYVARPLGSTAPTWLVKRFAPVANPQVVQEQMLMFHHNMNHHKHVRAITDPLHIVPALLFFVSEPMSVSSLMHTAALILLAGHNHETETKADAKEEKAEDEGSDWWIRVWKGLGLGGKKSTQLHGPFERLWIITPHYASRCAVPYRIFRHSPVLKLLAQTSPYATLTDPHHDILTLDVVEFILAYLANMEADLTDEEENNQKFVLAWSPGVSDKLMRLANACCVLEVQGLLHTVRTLIIRRLESAGDADEFRTANTVCSLGQDRCGLLKWFDANEIDAMRNEPNPWQERENKEKGMKQNVEDCLMRGEPLFGLFTSTSPLPLVQCPDCQEELRWLYWRFPSRCQECGVTICASCFAKNKNGKCKTCHIKCLTKQDFRTRAFTALMLPLSVLKRAASINSHWRAAAGSCISDYYHIQYRHTQLNPLTEIERRYLWVNRASFVGHGPWLLQLLHATDWNDHESAQEVLTLLLLHQQEKKAISCFDVMCGRQCQHMTLLELGIHILRYFKGPIQLRAFAISCFSNASPEQIDCILPELVDSLRNEKLVSIDESPLLKFLIHLATVIIKPKPINKELKEEKKEKKEEEVAPVLKKKITVLDVVRDPAFETKSEKHAPPPELTPLHFRCEMLDMAHVMASSTNALISDLMHAFLEHLYRIPGPPLWAKRRALIQALERASTGDRSGLALSSTLLPCPFDANRTIGGFDVHHIKVMDSAAAPVFVGCWWAADGGEGKEAEKKEVIREEGEEEMEWDDVLLEEAEEEEEKGKRREKRKAVDCSVIYKKEDMRKDDMVLRLVRWMNDIWKRAGIPIHLLTYRVNTVGVERACVQVVSGACTLYEMTEKTKSATSILAHLIKHNVHEALEAQTRFIRSLAGWNVAAALLGVCDRHLDNIMIAEDGTFFQIDFGWLIHGPKIMEPRTRMDQFMVEALGGEKAAEYTAYLELCRDAAFAVRPHLPTFYRMLSWLCTCEPPLKNNWSLTLADLDHELCQRFLPGHADEPVAEIYKRWMKMDDGLLTGAAVSVWDWTHRVKRQGGLFCSLFGRK